MTIKPCPFKHSKKERGAPEVIETYYDGHYAYSVRCNACMTIGPIGETKRGAIRKWNARAEK